MNAVIKEMELELIERGVISPPEYTPEQARVQIMEIIVTEGKDSSLGRQVWQYCKVVDFEYEAIRPILDKEPRFFSQLEELGSMQFNLLLLQIRELKAIRHLLTPQMVIEPKSIDHEEWLKNKTAPIKMRDNMTIEQRVVETAKNEVDFESLWKNS